jgi:hypothetical protein
MTWRLAYAEKGKLKSEIPQPDACLQVQSHSLQADLKKRRGKHEN